MCNHYHHLHAASDTKSSAREADEDSHSTIYLSFTFQTAVRVRRHSRRTVNFIPFASSTQVTREASPGELDGLDPQTARRGTNNIQRQTSIQALAPGIAGDRLGSNPLDTLA